jgi:chloramphenicol-sensitive protein RarD
VTDTRQQQAGVLYALAAFGFWGLAPIYFKAVGHVPPLEILGHRVVWSVLLTAVLLSLGRQWRRLRMAAVAPRVVATLLLSALLVAGNWFVFILAVTTGQVLQASLGYFINPLVNVLLGMVFLQERLRGWQGVAVLLAAAGTTTLTVSHGELPWIALLLAFSFGVYGLLRKTVRIESLAGLFVETTVLCPVALGYLTLLQASGSGHFATGDLRTSVLLAFAGAITALPLVWFTSAARRLRYATIGLFQYLAPTLHFLLAVVIYGEPFTRIHLVTFTLIWTGLAIFMADAFAVQRRGSARSARRSGSRA